MGVLLDVRNLTVRFGVRRKGAAFGQKAFLTAVDNISFSVERGKTLRSSRKRFWKRPQHWLWRN